MIFNIDYLMQHISYELHTIIKNWTEHLSAQTKPEVVCVRKDMNDEYLPFSVFKDSILSAEDTFTLTNSPPIFCCNFYSFCSNVLLAHNLFSESPLIRDDLISSNCVKKAEDYDIMCNYSALIFERQEMDEPHNPYDQEIRESLSIENGDMEMYRKSISEDYIGKLGTLSKDALRNVKNLAIVLMTLASRAAIRGGLLPEIAFSMSDIFIQKIEEMTDPVVTLNLARQFQMEYVKAVAEIRQQKKLLLILPPKISGWNSPKITFSNIYTKKSASRILQSICI